MNNAVYRMKVRHVEVDGMAALHFEHPTVGGSTPGGWMNTEVFATPRVEVPPSENLFNVDALQQFDSQRFSTSTPLLHSTFRPENVFSTPVLVGFTCQLQNFQT